MSLEWTELDRRSVDTARVLAMDAVQKVGNGHPGTAMALAPAAYLLFQKVMRHDPSDPAWIGRDRFVLSNGHASLTLYTQLFLGGFGLELDDLKAFRTWGSRTPGHPEYGHTAGVETTTGPLGQGISTAVGMAMDARYVRGLLDSSAASGTSPFDHFIYVMVGDGCLEEGVSSEASSLAGHQKLGNVIVIYDDNHITIEGDTNVAFTEDVLKRYESYDWHVQHVDLDGNGDMDVNALHEAVENAKQVTDKPSIIRLRTLIAWPAPHAQNTAKAHGAALGDAEVAATKEILGFDPSVDFEVSDEVLEHSRGLVQRGAAARAQWDQNYQSWRESHPAKADLLDRLVARRLPDGFAEAFPVFDSAMATRQASGKVINAIAGVMPELWGGSADLAESNMTTIEGGQSYQPEGSPVHECSPYGRIIHFGVREHAMGAALNGIALGGLTRPFGGTFLVFSDYMRGAVRLSALMGAPVTYVWTHDSVGLGEDGPTHQPIEHLTALRAMPGLAVVRPGDPNETSVVWRSILERDKPAALALSRQSVPIQELNHDAARGGYIRSESSGEPQVILIATGSEVSVALEAQTSLESAGISTRVVSMPCVEWFEEEEQDYRDSVLPPSVKARVSVEAGHTMCWDRLVGSAGRTVGITHFGASADAKVLFREFGITPEAVVDAAKDSLDSLSINS